MAAMSERGPRILIVAGEESGDAHAAELVRGLRSLLPHAEIEAWGGERLRAAGAHLHENIVQHAVMGLFPVLLKLFYFIGLYLRIVRRIRRWRPDLVIPVDFPGLNLRIARRAKRLGARVLYYVSPQVWAWWRWRIRRIGGAIHKMLVLFPFEEALYRERGIEAEYVGHPLLDRHASPPPPHAQSRSDIGAADDRHLVALLPGSRRGELRRLVPLVLDAAVRLRALRPAVRFVLVAANRDFAEAARRGAAARGLEVQIVQGRMAEVLSAARLAIVASGTATLECLYFRVPMVIVYRLDPLSWLGAKLVLATRHIGLANIIAGDGIVPEILDWRHRPERVVQAALPLLDDGEARQRCLQQLERARALLGEPGASERAAHAALRLLGAGRELAAPRTSCPVPTESRS
ncbi:MAG: lipid-A-disaccharide synthase 1 [Planctomycetota bacterium]|nr:MAG: lipid-A-disaccharide synthase 1 [Planctomycetota bacterium]